EFTARGHALLRAIREAAVPVIAVLDGLSLGGGSELALACDAIVATGRGSLGFPETGIGIYPGLGGTQNLPRRVGTGLARYLIYTGAVLGAEQAAELGLVDRLVALEELDEAIAEIARAGKPAGERRPTEPTGRWAEIARAFDVPADAILAGEVTSDDPEIARAYERVRTRKAPLALRKADALIGRALELPYDEGLRAELAGLEEIFRSHDALVGLRSVLDRSRPSFEGR
ncbi:MAG: enoyl-CoA hydratase/isomerase family protein, partial [Planctomycetota bacterium]